MKVQINLMPQNTTETTLEEAKTYMKAAVWTKWTEQHPAFIAHDQYHTWKERSQQSSFGSEQGITGSKNTCTPSSGSSICQCGKRPQAAEHIL
ncbi:hypothetical protein PoB_000316600 [Plakobranchus ocellatus]|uniref:Uncharacterized protein n=1 Tax=Plakobranchus ocellatus TaxID=259542 RepID=A0AAV3Y2K3_9GAST|nr:hypothetical protein PoB_000316600 [Plakobranchus ocellatus]